MTRFLSFILSLLWEVCAVNLGLWKSSVLQGIKGKAHRTLVLGWISISQSKD